MVKGQVRMRCGGRSRVMKEGDVLPVAPGRKHSFTGIGPALLLELSMPCEIADNYFTNRDIPIGGNAPELLLALELHLGAQNEHSSHR